MIFCKYGKGMNNLLDPEKNIEKGEQISQLYTKSVYMRDDDQDWGSSGINDIQAASE